MSNNLYQGSSTIILFNENPNINIIDNIKDHSLDHSDICGFRAFGKELTNMGNDTNVVISKNTTTNNANRNETIKLIQYVKSRTQSVNLTNQNNNSLKIDKESAKLININNTNESFNGSKEVLMQIPIYSRDNKLTDNNRNMDKQLNGIGHHIKIKGLDQEHCDIESINDPQSVAEYAKAIFKYLHATESKCQPASGYMAKQPDINEKMRAILVDWLIDVQVKFKLLEETLFLTVNIVDRYLNIVQVSRQRLQLIGVTAMLIASKYEEIYAPEVKDFVYVTDKAYTKEEILEMEGNILLTLNFNLTTTSSSRFLERYVKLNHADEKTFMLAKYLIELALVEYKMLKYSSSNIASSALYLANKIFKKDPWNDILTHNTNYTEIQLRPCAKDLCVLLQNSNKSSLQAAKKKFSTVKYFEISKIQLDKQ